jgi:hypothetical protein
MKPVEQDLASYLLSQVEKFAKGRVLERYAISYNTLRKIEAGLPLRPSLKQRLEARLRSELTHTHENRPPDAREN